MNISALRMMVVGGGMALGIATLFVLDLDRHLSLEALKTHRNSLLLLAGERPWETAAIFCLAFASATALSIPGAVLSLSLAAGTVFGVYFGTLMSAFSLTLGSSVAFLAARYVARDWVRARLKRRTKLMQIKSADELLILFTLRLTALVPYFIVNLTMAFSKVRLLPFAALTFLGVLPSMALYVNAGTQLGRIGGLSDILSAEIIGSLLLLGIFPLLMRYVTRRRLQPER